METLLTISIVATVVVAIVAVAVVLYLDRQSHVDRQNLGSAGEHYTPGDPGSSAEAD